MLPENRNKKSAISELNIHPQLFHLKDPSQEEMFKTLLQDDSSVTIYDTLREQLMELHKIRNPEKKFSLEELNKAVEEYLNNINPDKYGVWVYYPWLKKVVHILDEQEFTEVRTARNLYKITNEEREYLSHKKIGIIGMSVGQSVAVTMAIERIFGELRIADFDSLELSNLNRIRSGIVNLGLPKVVVTAREIAEIDPFLKVKCYTEGINEDNINEFITADGKLDVLIDECDSVEVKVLCREKAKDFKIPVIMEASDRGTLDIERFDLEPDRPIFHGRIPDLTYNLIKSKTREEILPYIFSIAGEETVSQRMKLSLGEIGKTITTWPQLASAVVMGGGVSTDTCRRVLLGQLKVSGRFFIDLEELISDKAKKYNE